MRLRLTGDDRPGVVHEISTAISDAGFSISRLGTVTDLPGTDGSKRFEITVQLAVPVRTGLDATRSWKPLQAWESPSVDHLTGDDVVVS